MKIYDLVKETLANHPETRDSDKRLMWFVWMYEGSIKTYNGQYLDFESFKTATAPETIRRCRQKIQQMHPEYLGSREVRKTRREKSENKGTFIFRELL